ncbi:hypothetical protein LCGC14_1328450, partial [marine sediment metagenome]
MERTAFAAARENTRYAINGVLWERAGKRLLLVATDGRRLAQAVGELAEETGRDVSAIVPSKAVALFQRVLQDEEQAVQV